MAQVEPMDVDSLASDFDDKENSLQNSNVLKSPNTEKGYEELDASEYSIKLRYSITPANSPMSRSYTAKGDSGPNSLNNTVDNLTRSLNSTITKADVLKTPKLPLQALPTSQYANDRSRDEEGNMTVTISGANNDDNLSLPSTSSSAVQTPEATTPTKEIPKSDGSPIMRGLKSVFNMFRSSHSPIPPTDDENHKNIFNDAVEEEKEQSISKLPDSTPIKDSQLDTVLASTPISSSIVKDAKDLSKRSSPLKESVVFNDDLERELQWQDETEIYFKNEKIPIHKLLFPSGQSNVDAKLKLSVQNNNINNLNPAVEYMDVSNNVSYKEEKSITEEKPKNDYESKTVNNEMSGIESDNEFLDCETTYTQNKSYILETVQECSKPSPLVFRTDSIPNEACLEDYIEPIKESALNDKMTKSKSEELNKNSPNPIDICSLPSENLSNAIDNVPVSAKTNILNDTFSPLTAEYKSTDIISELHIKDVSNAEDISNNIKTVLAADIFNNTLLESDKIDVTMQQNIGINFDNDCMSTSITEEIQPHIQNCIENNRTLQINMNTNDLDLELNNKTSIHYKDDQYSVIESSENVRNLPVNEIILREDVNFDTDNDNTTRLLFNIDALMLNQVNFIHDTDFISNASENTEYINPNIEDTNHFISETKEFDDTVITVVNEILDNNVSNSTKIFNQVNNDREVGVEIVSPGVKSSLVTTNINESLVSEDQLLQNIIVNNISNFDNNLDKNFDDSISLDRKHIITENVSSIDVNNVEDVKNIEMNNLTLVNNYHRVCNEYPQDITMDSLEPNINIAQSTFEINKNDISSEIDYSCGKNETNETNILRNHIYLENNLPQPLDIPLESVDNNKIEENIILLNCKDIEDSSQIGNELVPNILLKENKDEMQTQCDFDKCSNIIPKILNNPTTNLTTCLQKLNMESVDTKSQQKTPDMDGQLNNTVTKFENNIQQDSNFDIGPKASITLPDVVNIINNTEVIDNYNTPEVKTHIVKQALCIEDNVESNVIDEEIVISANNSPYVSVTELNPNVEESNNPNQAQDKTTHSPPLSPKCISKGYNINFDEVENPFATKTNIRMSPILDEGLRKPFTPLNNNKESKVYKKPQNKRLSQTEGKNSDLDKKRFNESLDTMKKNNMSISKNEKLNEEHIKEGQDEDSSGVYVKNQENSTFIKNKIHSGEDFKESSKKSEVNKCIEIVTITDKNVIDDNQKLRNVFNIPEIDDINFNPFKTKSRICVTPPPCLEFDNNTETKTEPKSNNQENTTIRIEDVVKNEVINSSNTINASMSSINTDKDTTVREVNTEDEDTVEGPFFEAEDLVEVIKVHDSEAEKDSMQFKDLPATINTDNVEKGELFIDAEAFEFLLNQNKSNVVADSGKESLFLKFDPLFAKRVSSESALAALSSIQKRQSTPKKVTRGPNATRNETSPMAGPSNITILPENNSSETVNIISKPMMVVNPAIAKQPVATPRISLTPKANRQSLTFSSPAMVVIDRLLSLSGNTSLLDENIPTAAENRNHEANIVLVQLRELLAEKELHVHSLKSESKELRDKLTTLESHVKSLENKGEERLKKVNNLNEQLTEKTKINKSMAVVVEEYERTIASLIAEMEQEKKRNAEERIKLINERDEQTVHLTSMECSFSDLHSKYEKCKQIVMSMKANEEAYKKSFKEFDENYLKMQKNYDLLKQHATSKLNHANQELEKMNKAHDAEVLKFTAMIKRKDLHITSLEESLAQKNKAIEELTEICDDLINKVG